MQRGVYTSPHDMASVGHGSRKVQSHKLWCTCMWQFVSHCITLLNFLKWFFRLLCIFFTSTLTNYSLYSTFMLYYRQHTLNRIRFGLQLTTQEGSYQHSLITNQGTNTPYCSTSSVTSILQLSYWYKIYAIFVCLHLISINLLQQILPFFSINYKASVHFLLLLRIFICCLITNMLLKEDDCKNAQHSHW
jgi:hypothetical protein